ncbi:hypothetical protein PAXRUDRAFT_171254, partial [Paxillus rubicundulus Ve08.2h10]
LELLAIAANITQSDCACLDVVLGTLANLYQTFPDPMLDQQVCKAVHASLEKCWVKANQPIFILVMVFNLYVQTSCFAASGPLRCFDHIGILYRRLTYTFMVQSLTAVNLIEIWHEYRPILSDDEIHTLSGAPPNGLTGLVELTMQILSIVPNSTTIEHLFSQFGIIHTYKTLKLTTS